MLFLIKYAVMPLQNLTRGKTQQSKFQLIYVTDFDKRFYFILKEKRFLFIVI